MSIHQSTAFAFSFAGSARTGKRTGDSERDPKTRCRGDPERQTVPAGVPLGRIDIREKS